MNLRRLYLLLLSGLAFAAAGLADEPTREATPTIVTLGFQEIAADSAPDGVSKIEAVTYVTTETPATPARLVGPNCPDCCHDCGYSVWSIRAGIISLARETDRSIPLTAGAEPYASGDLHFARETGPLLSIVGDNLRGTAWGLDATYFRVDDFSARAAGANLTTLLTTPPINFSARPVTTDYTSQLTSVEFDVRRSLGSGLALLAGYRHLSLDELLRSDLGGGAAHAINTENDLSGFQYGIDVKLVEYRAFSLEGFAKGGVYANHADSLTTIQGVGGAVPEIRIHDHGTATSGEFGLTGVLAIGRHFTIRGGYQVLRINRIALAPEQLSQINIATGEGAIDRSSHIIYHGFTLEAELVW